MDRDSGQISAGSLSMAEADIGCDVAFRARNHGCSNEEKSTTNDFSTGESSVIFFPD